jgi:hypothetical protein
MKHEAVPAAHETLQALQDECEIKQTIGLTDYRQRSRRRTACAWTDVNAARCHGLAL